MSDTKPRAITVTRYAVFGRKTATDEAQTWCPYTSRHDAECTRRDLDIALPASAPFRIVRVDMTITEETSDGE